jgi:hypothetical protein
MPIPLPVILGAVGLGAYFLLRKKPGAVVDEKLAAPLPPGVVDIPGLKVSLESAAVARQMALDSPNAVVNPDPIGDPTGEAVAIFMISRQFQATGTPKEEADRLAAQQVRGSV